MIYLFLGAAPIPRPRFEDLKQRWEAHMIAGETTNENYSPITRRYERLAPAAAESVWPYTRAEGRPADAFSTNGGIVVFLPARQPLILWRRDGWTISGGLLQRVGADESVLELYGRLVLKEEGFYPPTRMHDGPPTSLVGIEFFLLWRSHDRRTTRIVRQWAFGPPYSRNPDDVRSEASGEIVYDAARRTVMVTFRGLGAPIVEAVTLAPR
jgi:hypothetical protein